MELRALQVFVEVVRQGGFSRAAETVFMTQSAVSKAVKQLEDELGLILLDRAGHRSTLTDAGEIVYRHAVSMLTERRDLLSELTELRGLGRGRLRIGMPPIGNDILWAPLFAIYRKRYPGIEIRLVEHGSKRLEEMVSAGEIDLGASLLPAPDIFESQEVRKEPIDALIQTGHPLANKQRVSMTDLAELPFILYDSGFALNPLILGACSRAGYEPSVIARSSQVSFIAELVAAGLGVGFMPRLIAERKLRPGVSRVEIDAPDMDWHMAWIWRKGAYLPHAARAWLELARTETVI